MMFLADEGVDRSIVNGLRLAGFDVFYTIDEMRALEDEVILQFAANENRILITKDKEKGFMRCITGNPAFDLFSSHKSFA